MKSESLKSINGVTLIYPDLYPDCRGVFTEVFRLEWVKELYGEQLQVNCTHSGKGVVRGLHFHRFQTDIWFPSSGIFLAGLADMRPDSPTFRGTVMLELNSSEPACLLIPPGVAHGYVTLTDATLLYLVNRYYDGSDEYGVAWDDPDLALDWGTDSPILSERDRSNGNISSMSVDWLRNLFADQTL